MRDARGFRALAIFRRGRLRDAEADAEDALRAAPRTYGFAFPAVTAVLAEVLMERGELGKAERRLAVARVPDRLGVLDLFCVAAEGRLLRKRGDFMERWRASNVAARGWWKRALKTPQC